MDAMAQPVFISYARMASADQAVALKKRLASVAFLDTSGIEHGDEFPPRLLDALLGARVVVVFATGEYATRQFCRLELRLALSGGDSSSSHIVVALGGGAEDVLDGLPPQISLRNWPEANDTEQIARIVEKMLERGSPTLLDALGTDAPRIARLFLEQSGVPDPADLRGVPCALPPGVAGLSIGSKFVGRVSELRALHRTLVESGRGQAARVTSRIVAGAGFGKTRLAIEYLHRFGPPHFPGGLFWVNAAAASIEDEFWRVLSVLDPKVPDLAIMRRQERNVRRELEGALRGIARPALYVIDNVPEAVERSDPHQISEFCPAVGSVTVLATSRQDASEPGVRSFRVDVLDRDAAILLLTADVAGAGQFEWESWGTVADWVAELPVALDLLNRCLAMGAIAIDELMTAAAMCAGESPRTPRLDTWREALRGQMPEGAVMGITEAFRISCERLDARSRLLANLLAHLGPMPIPEELMKEFGPETAGAAERAALRSRHFVTGGGDGTFGAMHRLTADFLRHNAGSERIPLVRIAGGALEKLLDIDPLDNAQRWGTLRQLRGHAEGLLEASTADPASLIVGLNVAIAAARLASKQEDHVAARLILQKAVDVSTRALGESDENTLACIHEQADAALRQGDFSAAYALHERVESMRSRILGPDHLDTISSTRGLGLALRLRGGVYGHGKDLQESRRLLGSVVTSLTRILGERHPRTLTAMSDWADTLMAFNPHPMRAADTHGTALQLRKFVLDARIQALGEEDADTIQAMSEFGTTLLHVNAPTSYLPELRSEGIQYLERALDITTRVYGAEHRRTMVSMDVLAYGFRTLEQHSRAREVLEQALRLWRRHFGDEHPDTLNSMNNLAATLCALGDCVGARQLHERVLSINTSLLGEEHPSTLLSLWNLAMTLSDCGHADEAVSLLHRCLKACRAHLAEDHWLRQQVTLYMRQHGLDAAGGAQNHSDNDGDPVVT